VSRGRKANPALIGVFVLGAAALAVAGVVVFGSGRFFRKQVDMVCYFSGSVNGLNPGAPVKFRGVPIGTVSEIRFRLPPPELFASPAQLRIPVWIQLDETKLSEFRGAARELTRERLDQLIDAGLRAQLQTESYVTGVLYVGIDFFPGSPVVLMREERPDFLEIPTMPTTLEQAFENFTKVMARVDKLDIEGLMDSLRHAVDGVDGLVRSPEIQPTLETLRATLTSIQGVARSLEPTVGPTMKNLQATTLQARTSLAALDQTLARVSTLVDPQAPLAVELTRTLTDLGEAARSVGSLADYLDRNPNAILTGRPGS